MAKGWLNYPAEQLRAASDETLSKAPLSSSPLAQTITPSGDPNAASWITTPLPYGSAGVPYVTGNLEKPLYFDYPPGINLIATPRAGYAGLLPFAALRNLAALCAEIRLPIELLKREIRALEWEIAPRNESAASTIEAATARFQHIDGLHTFDAWTNMLVEELLVTDAVTIYLNTTRDGQAGAVDLLDGATIRPLLDGYGRIPTPPVPAYVQTIRGIPSGKWTRAEMWYLPYNTRVASPYGRPPVEDVILTVNTALRRSYSRLAGYTEGNIPESLVGLPSTWSLPQINAFQEYWDALIAGDMTQQRRMKFFPVDGTQIPVHEFNRSDGSDVQLDEWLLRVGCWAVGVSPAEFGLVPGSGLGGSGFAEAQADVQYRMGLGPIAQYLKSLFDSLLRLWGWSEDEFKWVSLEKRTDALQQAQIDDLRIRQGVYSLAYVQDREGVPVEMRPDGPQEQPLAETSPLLLRGAGLQKQDDAETGNDDPDSERKTEASNTLRAEMLRYLLELQQRVVGAVDPDNPQPLSDSFWNSERKALVAVLLPKLTQMAIEGANLGADKLARVGIVMDPDLVHAAAARWAREHTDEVLASFNVVTQSSVGEVIANWIETPGATRADLEQQLLPILGNNVARAERVGVTEVTRAMAEGEFLEYEELGIELPPDVDGERFGPPAHPNCRCWTRVVRLPDNTWVAVWQTNRDEIVCKRPVNTPWGKVQGCRALNNVVISDGDYMGMGLTQAQETARAAKGNAG